MTRDEIKQLLIEKLREIQELSGREQQEITGETRPLVDLVGFDSHNDLELSAMLADPFNIDDKTRLGVSADGKRPLCVREIVDNVMENFGN